MNDEDPARKDEAKRAIYDKMSPRRKKFVDRIGFELWDPFQEPKTPMDIRTDSSRRTVQDLTTQFLRSRPPHKGYSQMYAAGALECALGLMQENERWLGVYDFCVWYHQLRVKEGLES